jgi:hypothetical protein
MHDERDLRDTSHREMIKTLYKEREIVPSCMKFGCASYQKCSENGGIKLHTGNWAFVGHEYGQASINGLKAKILFVAMDRGGYGGADKEQFPDTQKSFRGSIESPSNPHMGGVSLILQALVNKQPIEQLSGMCALTNAVKCVKSTGSMSTNASKIMISECATHLLAEISTLKPNIIITQGTHPTETILGLFENRHLLREFKSSNGRRKTSVYIGPCGTIILTTPHPARQAGLKWKRGEIPDFWSNAIALARDELFIQLNRRI